MRRLRKMKSSHRLGMYGAYSKGMWACSGVRLPLRWLQALQAVTTFIQLS